MNYTHLSQGERYQIQCYLQLQLSIGQIAQKLGRHRSTIAREIARNGQPHKPYCAQHAHTRAHERVARTNARRFDEPHWALVMRYLQLDLSPQQVSERLRLEQRLYISHSHIYNHLHQLPEPRPRLRCGQRRRKQSRTGAGQLPERVGIEQRPNIVEQRSRLGDWEGDTIVSGKGGLAAVLTLNERHSRYTLCMHLHRCKAEETAEAMIELLRPHRHLCHTLTLDNGKEFAEHAYVGRRLEMQVYFADPRSPWQRGTNENSNGLLRYYFAKGSDLSAIEQWQVLEAVYRLNHRPRRCLGWKTPHEVFHGYEVSPLTLDGWRAS